ncbi:hypothetical protein V8C86DRAFT_2432243 [Haematococcus lacustris]
MQVTVIVTITIYCAAFGRCNRDREIRVQEGVSPHEAALLAGHAATAQALQAMEQGVPLHWSPQRNAAYPAATRLKIRQLVQSLSLSSWFCCLPGPARQALVAAAASDIARTTAWPTLTAADWQAAAPLFRMTQHCRPSGWDAEDQQLALLDVSAVHANNVAITKLANDTYDVLLSLGCGDLRLIRVQQGQLLWATAALHPLRPPPPLAGVRALKLETAFWSPTGELCCVVWAVGSKSSTQPAACQPLSAPEPAPSLQVTGVRLVGASCLPPHCTLPSPGGEAVVLGLDPVGCEGAGGELGGGPAASAPAVGGPPSSGAAGGADLDRGDMEEDDMDPRTLEAAAARLAQYTSDQPVGNLPLQQWADIYKETGAEEVCSDAGCDLVMLVTHSMQPETNAPQAAGGVVPSMGAQGEAGQGSRAAEAALGTAAAARGAGAGGGGAYIAAGKTQKKHLLVGDAGCRAAGVSAVLVEGAKFCYVYGVVGVRQEFGEQQVLDMQLSEGERVMGARLLSEYLPSSPVESDRQHQPSCSAAEQQGKARAMLLVLTQHRLLVQMLSRR